MTSLKQIGRYELVRPLGTGGMSRVFLAYDPDIKREVAIKLLAPERALDEEALARFQQEAEIVARLQHPFIVPIFDFGQVGQSPYMVLPYLAGGSLADKLAQGTLALPEVAALVGRLAVALDVAHAQNIIHRDIKPGNILFDGEGQCYLGDFGVAKIRAGWDKEATGRLVLGTPQYMSPEQVRGQVALDGRSDLYGLGVVLFQALTGHCPFVGSTPMATAVAHIMDPIPHILDIRPDLPPEIQLILHRALAKEREQRYAHGRDFAEELQLVADGRGYHLHLRDL
jgi:eukaryotic-like serine/threonine-protein kinase